jgi:hypothetical protein
MNIVSTASDFPSQINDVSVVISKHDNDTFRLIHGDFSHHNVLHDDPFNMLAAINWERSFVGSPEMAACFPMRLQVYPDASIPAERYKNGRAIDGSADRHLFHDREKAIQTCERLDIEKLSSFVWDNRVQEDIFYIW